MIEIKPNWTIAQQISRRHTLISFGISIPLFLSAVIIAIIVIKLFGIPEAGLFLKGWVNAHKKLVYSIVLFIHFVPINFYSIIKVFQSTYPTFELKIIPK